MTNFFQKLAPTSLGVFFWHRCQKVFTDTAKFSILRCRKMGLDCSLIPFQSAFRFIKSKKRVHRFLLRSRRFVSRDNGRQNLHGSSASGGRKFCRPLVSFCAGKNLRIAKIKCRENRANKKQQTSVNPILSPRFRLMSVRKWPGMCLRLWCSPRYQRISPLHREFPSPLHPSSLTVSNAAPPLSSGI